MDCCIPPDARLYAGSLVWQYSNTGIFLCHISVSGSSKIITQAYNGGLLLSRFRNDNNMSNSVRDELRDSAKKFGLDFDKMCPSDNSWCPNS